LSLKFDNFQFAPHPLAPDFAADSNPQLMFKQLISEVSSRNMSTTEELRKLIRQAGLVNLWFYLKFICGYSGPYDQLNTELHVEVCNFRQRVATTPGIKAGLYLPRFSLKSTCADHGANGWELIRNPNLRIATSSEIYDRALGFVQMTNSTFSKNEFHKWLYPEHLKVNKDDQELILSSRTKNFVEPNLRPIGTGGASAGAHYDLFVSDDPVSDAMLNSDRSPTADMIRVGNWLYSNISSLVVDWNQSRILFIGTRYHIDDPFETTMLHAKEHLGDWDEEEDNYPVDPNGEWVVYYRPVICRGESIIKEKYTMDKLKRMELEDPWTYWTQFMNRPRMAKQGELGSFEVKPCKLLWHGEEDFANWCVQFEDEDQPRSLTEAVLVAAGDPAASEKRVGPGTSRSAAGVIARFSDDRIVLLEAKAGFVSPTKFFDWLFDHKEKYKMLLGTTWVEAQAGFKAFIPILRREQQFRNKVLSVQPVPALGEKQTTIKNILWPYLEKGKLFATASAMPLLLEELRVFPSRKMDILDMLKIAVFKSYRPDRSEDDDDDEDDGMEKERRKLSKIGKAGY